MKVDIYNKDNVIYQNTFYPADLNKSIEFFYDCFSNFDNNKYPIIIIESFNLGGYPELAQFITSYINLNKSSTIFASYRYNEDIKDYVAPLYNIKTIDTCEIKNTKYLFNLTSLKNDNYGEGIKHKRTLLFDIEDFFVDHNFFFNFRKNAKYIRKPHEIIIFTDGLSYSATSLFIKEVQLNGGAIIVGYDGNPNFTTFDASQSPSHVHSTEENKMENDSLSLEIENLGFTLRYTIMETFSKLDYTNEDNIPLEYQIYKIDERVKLYNKYDDSKYQDFINKALKIFEKYKKRCNPNNKNLLFINDECYFKDPHLHGGYECDNIGFWSRKCVPSYCDNGYIYDKRENKCIKDLCINTEQKNFRNINNKINYRDILICLFGIFQIIILICIFNEKFKNKKDLLFLILVIIDFLFIQYFY